MRGCWWTRVLLMAVVVMTAGSSGAFAQDPGQDPAVPEKPADAPPATPSAKKPPGQKNKDNAADSAEDQPKWDPQRAEKDIQVGQYYMGKGGVDGGVGGFWVVMCVRG